MPGFNDGSFDVLKLKINAMDNKNKFVSLMSYEVSLKFALVYNHGFEKIEGFEDCDES